MKIGFFVPCYIDAIHPQAAISTYSLLNKLGLDVEFIERGACCGLPELDMGYIKRSCTLEKGIAPFVADKGLRLCGGAIRHLHRPVQRPFQRSGADP